MQQVFAIPFHPRNRRIGHLNPDTAQFSDTLLHSLDRDDVMWERWVEVFRRLYTAVGLGPLAALTRLPGVKQGLDFAYERFAKNRLRLTGRCTKDGCAVPGTAG